MSGAKLVLAFVVALSLSQGCYSKLDNEKIPCDMSKKTSCPNGYVCTLVDGLGPMCRRPSDASIDAPASLTEAGVLEVASEASMSRLDAAVTETGTTGEAGGGPRLDGAVDGTANPLSDVPLLGSETGGPDGLTGSGGGPGGDAVGNQNLDLGRDVPLDVPSGGGGTIGTGGVGGTGGVTALGGATGTGGGAGGGPGTGGAVGTGGGIGTGGTGGIVGTGGLIGTGGTIETGGIVGTGGLIGTGGTVGTGGVSGTGGSTPIGCTFACAADEDCVNGVCVLRWGGMACSTQADCPSWAICCDGSNESCDATRLPAGDGTNAGQFGVSVDGLTVTDTITSLVWQRDGSGTRAGCSGSGNLTCTWAEANAYCAALTLGGMTGWRLPGRNELGTIVDFTRFNPVIDPTAFPSTATDYFWTSSPYAQPNSPTSAWTIDFGNGLSNRYDMGSAIHVRCVR